MKLFFLFNVFVMLFEFQTDGKLNLTHQGEVIFDSNYRMEYINFESKVGESVRKNLTLISVEYYSFDDKLHRGQILIHKDLVKDIIEIFEIIKREKFPIGKVIPINHYNWSDEFSMEDNNTSAFNYRAVKGTSKLSSHALGRAIDINPKQNPHINKGKYLPVNSNYYREAKGTITSNSFLIKEFIKRGWSWGGHWKRSKDYQHFEKLK